MEDKIQKIEKVAGGAELAEIAVLQRAVEVTLKTYQDEYSDTNRKNWEGAKRGLSEVVDRIHEKYFPEEEIHPHRMAALVWLQSQGWKVEKSKLYQDASAGKLVVMPGGQVRHSALLAYAWENLSQETDAAGRLKPLTEEEKKLDIAIKRKKDAQLQFELDKSMGQYMPKKDLALEMAARAGWLDAQLESLMRAKVVDWIAMAGGSARKADMVLDLMLAEKDRVMNEYASMEVGHVIFKSEG